MTTYTASQRFVAADIAIRDDLPMSAALRAIARGFQLATKDSDTDADTPEQLVWVAAYEAAVAEHNRQAEEANDEPLSPEEEATAMAYAEQEAEDLSTREVAQLIRDGYGNAAQVRELIALYQEPE